ncbi:hypothetical protein TIFTF001_016354 [Ficus carica]|uniref:Uncharacterized protein n=1 Tax=Ficus carica TaxID=3494 RepID=A0AA88D8P7_FICCA|nr:hypothetical protein TIFTF001_016354 [Ficus carica]
MIMMAFKEGLKVRYSRKYLSDTNIPQQGLDSYLYPSSSRRKPAAVPERGAALQMSCFQEGHVMVSNLPAISDAILWRAGSAGCEMWDGHCHGF